MMIDGSASCTGSRFRPAISVMADDGPPTSAAPGQSPNPGHGSPLSKEGNIRLFREGSTNPLMREGSLKPLVKDSGSKQPASKPNGS